MKLFGKILKNKKYKTMLQDIQTLDPALFSDQASAKKMIALLIDMRPKVKLRPSFKAELRQKIEERIAGVSANNEASATATFFRRHRQLFALSTVSVATILVALTFTFNYKRLVSPQLISTDGQMQLAAKGVNASQKPKDATALTVKETAAANNAGQVETSEEQKSIIAPLEEAMPFETQDDGLVVSEKQSLKKETFVGHGWNPEGPAGVEQSFSSYDRACLPQPSVARNADSRADTAYHNTESYNLIVDNDFLDPVKTALSTFSVDVDTASYSNMRRFINGGSLPPKDAVRTEEMINYFSYDYKVPGSSDPFSVTTEMGACPWNPQNKLLLIGLQGKRLSQAEKPASNIVFLIDSSGSMASAEKMGLLKKSYQMLVEKLDKGDHISIVAYAGSAGVVLEPTAGNKKREIIAALDKIEAGGSTAGGEGIELAYKTAEKYFRKNGNNRIIIATDGDFNVGPSSNAEMVRLIEAKRDKGIFISVLGFGMGNYKDSKMEMIADKGNGNYFYIDTIYEAKKVMVSEMDSMLFAIAKDVKIQIEFNPAYVASYRLIGYENRVMKAEDFDDDRKDAGEIGAGHSVTALYEIVERREDESSRANTLRYQQTATNSDAYNSGELALIKLRYKQPKGQNSKLLSFPVKAGTDNASSNLQFASAVAEFGMLLRDSEHKGKSSYDAVIERAERYKGKDEFGYRGEFIQLVKKAKLLKE